MDYVLIKNGQLVAAGDVKRKDVLVGNDKIIEVATRIDRPEPETPVIDAEGKFILPGGVDSHIFFSELIEQDAGSLRRFNQAQIIGATTTTLEPLVAEAVTVFQKELAMRRNKQYGINADYGFHLSLNSCSHFTGRDLEYCLAHEGIASLYLRWPLCETHQDNLFALMTTAANNDIPVLVDMHKPGEWGEAYVGLSQISMATVEEHLRQVHALLVLSKKAGCTICLLNICFQEELKIIEAHNDAGHRVYAELSFPFHIADQDKLFMGDTSIYSGFPLVSNITLLSEDNLWRCFNNPRFLLARPMLKLSGQGVLDGSQVDNRPDEYILLKNLLSVLYTWGVQQGKLTMPDLVELLATRPARLMGLYPKKGVLQAGSDADIVIWDGHTIRNLYCHLPGAFEQGLRSFPLEGRVEFVFIKGRMVYNGESFSEESVSGAYLYRSSLL
ncbi:MULTISPECIES: amidohydrolase family protein [unclassified Carboxylicivirga]|uniref:amidohydrolase family protein n=1 Tax=Carboxylicivirga TaxID=1628153 RepID=UPI003D358E7A